MLRITRLILCLLGLCVIAASTAACGNNPYPNADSHRKVLYTFFDEAPKSLDPAVAYDTAAHAVTGNIYDTLLEYHYLDRPYRLIPGLAQRVPEGEHRDGGGTIYRFELRHDLLYQPDDCFALHGHSERTREVVADDIAFALMRIADPQVNSPVLETMAHIQGLSAFGQRLKQRRIVDPAFAHLRIDRQYAAVGGVSGIHTEGRYLLQLTLEEEYPQLLYWFAMPFTAPMPWEAVTTYDGREGRPHLADHPVGAGPYRLTFYNKQARMLLERNPNWYGLRHPEWHAPGATYPDHGEPRDAADGLLASTFVGKPLAAIERIDFRREKEPIPQFNKFLQGYYDTSGVIRESFDKVIREDRLSPEMAQLGIQLKKAVMPVIYYIGFNMQDRTVGAPGGDRARKLRQAMSLAVDAREYLRVFSNGRGIPAQSLLPPGIFGYDEGYRNPYRQPDLDRARALLAEAGYPAGVDTATGKPLRLSFDSADTSAQGLLRYQFFVNAWRKIGLNVEIAATNYNQFQQKVREGAYQIFWWGWVADYPDPENFMFLLWSEMARSKNNGPNTANFEDSTYDADFVRMRPMSNGPERLALIHSMRDILERERPWIELFFPENYALFHGWLKRVKPTGMSYPTIKYRDLDPEQRATLRARWNRPVMWPAYVLLALALLIAIPGILAFFRERQ